MTDRVEPALTSAQWDRIRWLKEGGHLTHALLSMGTQELGLAGLIASANEALPGSDPRKITRAAVVLLRGAADVVDDRELMDGLDALAGVLESYLPGGPQLVTARRVP